MKTKTISKSQIGERFECLSLNEKMDLFGLPKTLMYDTEREKRISDRWYSFSEDEKSAVWEKEFGSERNVNTRERKFAVNQ